MKWHEFYEKWEVFKVIFTGVLLVAFFIVVLIYVDGLRP